MLFAYKSSIHKLDRFHFFIKHLVLEVWCKPHKPFTTDLLIPDFKALLINRKNTDLIDSIEKIYRIMQKKPKRVRWLLQTAFYKNNNIEALCEGLINPIQYSDIKKIDKSLATELYSFFVRAYSFLDDSRINRLLDGINKRYKKFFSKGANTPVCPFCGLYPLLNEHNKSREAYDHFFPKEIYPFNSVNFTNLVPMCHTCNSKYKTRKDPINIKNGGPRKKVLFPFSLTYKGVDIKIDFKSNDLENLLPADVDILITSNITDKDIISSWKFIFGIEERYKAKCCEEAAYKGWLEEYNISKHLGSGLSFDAYIETKSTYPYLNVKFLEIAYLTACKNALVIT